MKKIPNIEKILAFIHCGLCLDEWKKDPKIKTKQSPKDYQQIQVGWTKLGLQIWCKRHNCNIMHIDFEGFQHPVNTTRHMTKKEIKELKKLK